MASRTNTEAVTVIVFSSTVNILVTKKLGTHATAHTAKNLGSPRNRTENVRLSTRPTRNAPSAMGADEDDRSVMAHARQSDLFDEVPNCRDSFDGAVLARFAAVQRSVEYRNDLLDVDAFLGHAQVVIGDGNDDGRERSPEPVDDEFADECDDGASERNERELNQPADDTAGDHEQDQKPKNLPAVASRQFGASLQAGPGTEPLDDAD